MSLKQLPNIINMIDYTTEEKSNITSFFILLEYCSSKIGFYNNFSFNDKTYIFYLYLLLLFFNLS